MVCVKILNLKKKIIPKKKKLNIFHLIKHY